MKKQIRLCTNTVLLIISLWSVACREVNNSPDRSGEILGDWFYKGYKSGYDSVPEKFSSFYDGVDYSNAAHFRKDSTYSYDATGNCIDAGRFSMNADKSILVQTSKGESVECEVLLLTHEYLILHQDSPDGGVSYLYKRQK